MAWLLADRVKNAWTAFRNNRDPTVDGLDSYVFHAATTSSRPDRVLYRGTNERTILAAILNKIAVDVANVNVRHVLLDEKGRYSDTVDDSLNQCLSVESNIDQTGRAMIQDAVASMLDEGCVAIVPVTTSEDPKLTESYDILELRVGKIVEWRPLSVLVDIYNETIGRHEQIWVEKRYTAIVENPFYSVMNEPNSTMNRLSRKLMLLDKIDNEVGSSKFDLIIQLPYLTKAEAKKKQASERRMEIEQQLDNSKLGIAYIDAAERVIQLNRPLENTLLGQIEYLTKQVFSQLGITQEILDGSADEKTMTNYNNRIVNTILLALTEEMTRKFLSKTARSRRHSITYFSDPFRLVPATQVPEIADKLTRNEIVTSNEIRQILGMKPSDDPNADELRNKNLNKNESDSQPSTPVAKGSISEESVREMLRRMDHKLPSTDKIQNEEELKK